MGRIACYAKEDGVLEKDIISALEDCIDFKDKKACQEVEEKLKDKEFENELLIAAALLAVPLFKLVKKAAQVLKIFIDKKTIDKINQEYEDLIRRLREINKEVPVELQI